MNQAKETHKDIELRSEEVQELMGRDLPCVLKCGMGVILASIIALFVLAMFVEYPTYSKIEVVIVPEKGVSCLICPCKGIVLDNLANITDFKEGDTIISIMTEKGDTLPIVCKKDNVIYSTGFFFPGKLVSQGDIVGVAVEESCVRNQYCTVYAFLPADIGGSINEGDALNIELNGGFHHMIISGISNCLDENGDIVAECRGIGLSQDLIPMIGHLQQVKLHRNAVSVYDKLFRNKLSLKKGLVYGMD